MTTTTVGGPGGPAIPTATKEEDKEEDPIAKRDEALAQTATEQALIASFKTAHEVHTLFMKDVLKLLNLTEEERAFVHKPSTLRDSLISLSEQALTMHLTFYAPMRDADGKVIACSMLGDELVTEERYARLVKESRAESMRELETRLTALYTAVYACNRRMRELAKRRGVMVGELYMDVNRVGLEKYPSTVCVTEENKRLIRGFRAGDEERPLKASLS